MYVYKRGATVYAGISRYMQICIALRKCAQCLEVVLLDETIHTPTGQRFRRLLSSTFIPTTRIPKWFKFRDSAQTKLICPGRQENVWATAASADLLHSSIGDRRSAIVSRCSSFVNRCSLSHINGSQSAGRPPFVYQQSQILTTGAGTGRRRLHT